MPRSSKAGYYAVRTGRTPGIYESWAECEAQVKGFADAKFKKFANLHEAQGFLGMDDTDVYHDDSGSRSYLTSNTNGSTSKAEIVVSHVFSRKEKDPDEEEFDVVYSDGACKGNGKPGSIAGVGVWWGHGDHRNISERCPGSQTNNRAELIAIIRVLENAPITSKPLMIKTDSQYSIKCMTEWLSGWRARGFTKSDGKPVLNKELITYISSMLALRHTARQKVRFKYVAGHSGIEGNEGADALANEGARLGERPEENWDSLREQVEKEAQEIARMTIPEIYREQSSKLVKSTPATSVSSPRPVTTTSVATASGKPLTLTSIKTIPNSKPFVETSSTPTKPPTPSLPRNETGTRPISQPTTGPELPLPSNVETKPRVRIAPQLLREMYPQRADIQVEARSDSPKLNQIPTAASIGSPSPSSSDSSKRLRPTSPSKQEMSDESNRKIAKVEQKVYQIAPQLAAELALRPTSSSPSRTTNDESKTTGKGVSTSSSTPVASQHRGGLSQERSKYSLSNLIDEDIFTEDDILSPEELEEELRRSD